MKKGIVTLIGVAGLATAASAQSGGTYTIVVSNEVNLVTPVATVQIWAAWEDPAAGFVFGGGNYDLDAAEAGWSSATLVLGLEPPNKVGTINGASIQGAAIGQVHLPPLGIFGSPDNPILLASYEWTTANFTERDVGLSTSNTNNFVVSDALTGSTTQLFPNDFKGGIGNIHVTPAPSALALLGLGGLVATRRRR